MQDSLLQLWSLTGFPDLHWQMLVMWLVVVGLLYLAVYKQFEPLLLVPIAFGALLANLPVWRTLADGSSGVLYYLAQGIHLDFVPPLLFLGIGAMTDFGPLIADPRTLFLGMAGQFGVLLAFVGAAVLGFSSRDAASMAVIGGADGPTSIFTATKLAPHLVTPIAVAAYCCIALAPLIQPPIMRWLTSADERRIRMRSPRKVGQLERLVFCLAVTACCLLLVPAASSLIAMLMLGNFLRECSVTDRLVRASQNEILNVITIFLGISIGLSMTGQDFLKWQTIQILGLGVVAFGLSTAAGVMLAKLMNRLAPTSLLNPLIGAAGVSAVPVSARVVHLEGQLADKDNYLLMHAMGPNVAGVIGTAVVAGYLLATMN